MKLDRTDWTHLALLTAGATGLSVGALAVSDGISPPEHPRPVEFWLKAAGIFAASAALSVGLAIGAAAVIVKIEGLDS